MNNTFFKSTYYKSRSGFTLIELLVVLLIISIVTSVAVLTIGRNENQEIESFAREVAQVISLAVEQAMLQPAVLGLVVGDRSIHFASLQVGKEGKQIGWEQTNDTALGIQAIPRNLEVKVEVGSMQKLSETKPQIIISTNGDITPFTIYLGKKGHKARYVIQGDAVGNITHRFIT